MSLNPTYDPEPDHNSYTGGSGDNRSGHSTPRGFYGGAALQPVSDSAAPYSNMASYRQATTGPPNSNYGDMTAAAGNGKSYRYATAETIPEDDGDASSPVDDSRQVQFTDIGSEKKHMGHSYKMNESRGGQGSDGGNSKKFMIVAILACVFALLFIIFLALFIWKASAVTETTTPAAPGASAGAAVGGGGTTSGIIGTTKQQAIVTTMAPDTIVVDPLEMYNNGASNKMVNKYTIKNDNNGMVEVLSLGARLNMLKTSRTYMHVIDTATRNASDYADDTAGAWLGPVCATPGNLHKTHFERITTTDGTLKLKATIGNLALVFTYALSNNNKLEVKVTGTTTGDSRVDVCILNRINLNNGNAGDITNSHKLQVVADEYLSETGWTPNTGELVNYKSLTSIKPKLVAIRKFLTPSDQYYDFRLSGPTGLRQAAIVEANSAKLTIQTNQPKMKMILNVTPTDSTFIDLGPRGFGPKADDNEYNAEGDLLRPGSTYEYIVTYMMT